MDGYWLASADYANGVWDVSYNGGVNETPYSYMTLAVRPVVCLPSDITGIVGDIVEIK